MERMAWFLKSITNSELLLTNLQKALTDLEQFRVVSAPGPLYQRNPQAALVNFYVVPAKGEKSLKKYKKRYKKEALPPHLTFRELEERIWPVVNFAAMFSSHRKCLVFHLIENA